MRRIAMLLGIVALPLAAFAVAALFAPWSSWSGRSYALGVIVSVAGLLTTRRARKRGLTRLGVALVVATLIVRVFSGARGESLTMTTTRSESARVLGRVFDEADVAVWGAHAAFAAGRFRDPDVPLVPSALKDGYAEMRAVEGDVPSPVVPTYLGLERPTESDVIVVDNVAEPRGAIVFLHGYGGSFTLPCAQLAQAAAEARFVTFCPSVGPRGDWWTAEGERVVRDTVRMAKARGLERIVLAGLSNGAVGAARIAPRMRGTLHALVLISGAPHDGAAPGVPLLVLQGRRDAMMPASLAREYAAAHSGTYVDLDAGHFALLVRRAEAMAALRAFLAR